MQIKNQHPVTLYPDDPKELSFDIDAGLDPDLYLIELSKAVSHHLVDPLYQSTGQDLVTITDDKGQTLEADTLTQAIMDTWINDKRQPATDDIIKEVYERSLIHIQEQANLFDNLWVNEGLSQQGLPLPSSSVRYTLKDDLIPIARNLLADTTSRENHQRFLASLGGYLMSENLNQFKVVLIKDQARFKQMKHAVNQLRPHLFDDLILDTAFEAIILPDDDIEAFDDPYAIGRVIDQATQETPNTWLLPTSGQAWLKPDKVMLLNLDQLAHGKSNQLQKEFRTLKKNLKNRFLMKHLSNQKITQLKSVKADNKHIKQHYGKKGSMKGAERRKRQHQLLKHPIDKSYLIKRVKVLLKDNKSKQLTQNTYEIEQESYNRPNRREPFNPDLPGTVRQLNYRPDIHIYLDTSGSITEENYQESVYTLIQLAQALKVNLYVTSFSHVIGQSNLLKVEGQSTKAIYQQFQNLPKVTGGTDFDIVWQMIQRRQKQYDELSFIITDFGYWVPRERHFNPQDVKHTYYIPITTTQNEWSNIRDFCQNFIQSMQQAGDHTIRQRVLM